MPNVATDLGEFVSMVLVPSSVFDNFQDYMVGADCGILVYRMPEIEFFRHEHHCGIQPPEVLARFQYSLSDLLIRLVKDIPEFPVQIIQSLKGDKTGIVFDNSEGRTPFLRLDYNNHYLIYPARRQGLEREFCGGALGVLLPCLEVVFPLNPEETMRKVYDALRTRFVVNVATEYQDEQGNMMPLAIVQRDVSKQDFYSFAREKGLEPILTLQQKAKINKEIAFSLDYQFDTEF